MDPERGAYSTIGLTILTDLMVVAMPTWIVYGLQMPLKRKIMIICFLSFGLAVTAIGTYRLWVFWYFHNGFAKNKDALYSVKQGLSSLEVSLAAIGACGPTVKWLLGLCIPFFADEDSRMEKLKRSDPSSSHDRKRKYRGMGESVLDTDTSKTEGDDVVELRQLEQAYKVPGWQKTSYGMKIRGTGLPKNDRTYAASDEPQLTITKTTEWDIDTNNVHVSSKDEVDERPEIHPRNVV